jgi:hypothetical protein
MLTREPELSRPYIPSRLGPRNLAVHSSQDGCQESGDGALLHWSRWLAFGPVEMTSAVDNIPFAATRTSFILINLALVASLL